MARWAKWLRPQGAGPVPIPAIPAGTWRASQPGKILRPATVAQQEYTQPQTVQVGPNGTGSPVTLSSTGIATSSVGPQGVGESWACDQCSVSTNKGQLGSTSTCTVYAGPAAIPAYQVAANLIGGGTQFALGGVTLTVGEYIWALWSGGATDGSEIAQLKVTGQRTALTR